MADWRDVGIENYKVAVELFERRRYRSAVSRFYYAAFSLITYELIQRSAAADFTQGRDTPGHGQLPRLVETWFVHFSEERRAHFARRVADLYRDRVAADYSLLRVDRMAAKEAFRLTESIFRYLGVNL